MGIFETIAKALTFNNREIDSLKSKIKRNTSDINKLKQIDHNSSFVINSEVFGSQDLSGGFGVQNVLSENATLALLKCSSPSQLKSFINTPRTYTLSSTDEYFDIGDHKNIYFTSCSEVVGYVMPYGTVSILNLNFTVSTSSYDDITVILRIFTDGDSFTESRVEFLSVEHDLYNYATKQDLDNRSYKHVRYEELIVLRNKSQLIPGQQYRITNYKTSTSQSNTQSANHKFDLIVTATSKNTLHHKAKAVINTNDSYYNNSKLEAWEIWYDIDNDTSKYAWATQSVVRVFDGVSSTSYPIEYCSNADVDFEISGTIVGKVITSGSQTLYCRVMYGDDHSLVDSEGDIVGDGLRWLYETEGTGVIYKMIDEFGNDCPYDFKNIQFKRWKITSNHEVLNSDKSRIEGHYTGFIPEEGLSSYAMNSNISIVDESDFVWKYTFNDASGADASMGSDCRSNIIRPAKVNGKNYLNNITITNQGNDPITSNFFDEDCVYWSVNDYMRDSSVGTRSYGNIIFDDVYQANFGDKFQNNYFGGFMAIVDFVSQCSSNFFICNIKACKFGGGVQNNIVYTPNNQFRYNNIGQVFNGNTVLTKLDYCDIGANCVNNKFDNVSQCIFGAFCANNTLLRNMLNTRVGIMCQSNHIPCLKASTVGSGFYYNRFKTSPDENGTDRNYIQGCTFGDYVHYNNFYSDQADDSSNQIQCLNVQSLLQGTKSNYNHIKVPVGKKCEIKVSKNSLGEIKVYCAADLIE